MEGHPSSSRLGSAPLQSKTLEELSEIYASAADAQEIAAASSDPVPARERLQSVLRDIAGAASFPAIVGEKLPHATLSPGFSIGSALAAVTSSPALRVLGASSLKCETLFCTKFQPSSTTAPTKKPPTQVLFHNHAMSQKLFLIFH